ncbi:MAG: hypothetical protein JWO60_1942 [Frankiales bacterium]|nr:hypothetical protein [Frankiales bacterium]
MKRIVVSTAVLALAIAGLGTAQAAPAVQKVTGGGQILATDADNGGGPGQTIAFNARGTGEGETDNADGQLQFNAHDGAVKFHGEVTCLVVTAAQEDDTTTPQDETAPISATLAGAKRDGGFFKLTVMDVDNDGPQSGAEPLAFDPEADDANCGEPLEVDGFELGRGNIVIHKEKAAGGSETKGGKGKPALSLR